MEGHLNKQKKAENRELMGLCVVRLVGIVGHVPGNICHCGPETGCDGGGWL